MNPLIQLKTIIWPLLVWAAARKLTLACVGMAIAMVVWVPRAYAPQREKPEKISIDNVTWNSQPQAFLVELSALFGIGMAGDNAGFTIRMVVEIAGGEGNAIDVVEQSAPLITREGSMPDADGFVQVEPQLIAWDRLGGTFTGPALVTVSGELRNPAGRGIALVSGSPIVLTIQ